MVDIINIQSRTISFLLKEIEKRDEAILYSIQRVQQFTENEHKMKENIRTLLRRLEEINEQPPFKKSKTEN